MAYFLRMGGIYSLYYTNWKYNFKVIAFILWGNPVTPKVHALNLAAIELTSVDRARLVHVIARLAKVPNTSIYSGLLLYRIFLMYCRPQVMKCYRTYLHANISSVALVNYGINKPEDFTAADFKLFDPKRWADAKSDYLVRLMNMYTRRGVKLTSVQNTLAKIKTPTLPTPPVAPGKPAVDIKPTPEKEKEETTEPMEGAATATTIPEPEPDEGDQGDQGGPEGGGPGEFGY
jgi:hypothetical protein